MTRGQRQSPAPGYERTHEWCRDSSMSVWRADGGEGRNFPAPGCGGGRGRNGHGARERDSEWPVCCGGDRVPPGSRAFRPGLSQETIVHHATPHPKEGRPGGREREQLHEEGCGQDPTPGSQTSAQEGPGQGEERLWGSREDLKLLPPTPCSLGSSRSCLQPEADLGEGPADPVGHQPRPWQNGPVSQPSASAMRPRHCHGAVGAEGAGHAAGWTLGTSRSRAWQRHSPCSEAHYAVSWNYGSDKCAHKKVTPDNGRAVQWGVPLPVPQCPGGRGAPVQSPAQSGRREHRVQGSWGTRVRSAATYPQGPSRRSRPTAHGPPPGSRLPTSPPAAASRPPPHRRGSQRREPRTGRVTGGPPPAGGGRRKSPVPDSMWR
ncbi:PREDICTED: basic salivary proline-rich protein 4-like [Galeopterus variegatus]|uniref:Basic salivary proline-rich protein 4-like n=1 Tax=Galeopterus variegatus TaxID=482537 RepID=A0ABM0QFP9_GALVR|nr:PREDICTED: basic salivary proline-rich protein 4-like [Galeopterus variegatus]